jgi:hypothetical protein
MARVRVQQALDGRDCPRVLRHTHGGRPRQLINLYAADPAGSAKTYESIEGDTFRRRRKDEALGETLVFERDSRGTVVSLLTEGYRYFRQ